MKQHPNQKDKVLGTVTTAEAVFLYDLVSLINKEASVDIKASDLFKVRRKLVRLYRDSKTLKAIRLRKAHINTS
ncbi:hypothetical protein [Vibrio harveyi]|uniref:hypothetical protein n=1 Tax=Vibrio harveyi TaxID=669 RepID=UPI000401A759|nr:hypothetical protein [Vibrio harveyi]